MSSRDECRYYDTGETKEEKEYDKYINPGINNIKLFINKDSRILVAPSIYGWEGNDNWQFTATAAASIDRQKSKNNTR